MLLLLKWKEVIRSFTKNYFFFSLLLHFDLGNICVERRYEAKSKDCKLKSPSANQLRRFSEFKSFKSYFYFKIFNFMKNIKLIMCLCVYPREYVF